MVHPVEDQLVNKSLGMCVRFQYIVAGDFVIVINNI